MLNLNKFTEEHPLQINLEENLFVCDCRTSDFIHWLSTTKVKVLHWEDYTCLDGYPESNIGKSLSKVRILNVTIIQCL